MKSNGELEALIVEKGCFSREENQRLFSVYFKDWYRWHEPLYKRFGISTGERILDIGCSYGANLSQFAASSVGLEYNETIVGFCRSIGLGVERTNIEEYGWSRRDDTFDLIWCTDFLIHLTSPYSFLLQLRDLMRDDSKLILQIPQYTPLIPQGLKKTYMSTTHYYAFHYPTLKYLLEGAGFEIVDSSGWIRHLPGVLNTVLDPFLKRFGPNVWFHARKAELRHASKQPTFPERMKHLFRG